MNKKAMKSPKQSSNGDNFSKLTKEKIKDEQRDILRIVENFLEKDVAEEYFINSCEKLSQADYMDVIEERSIDLLCGYPLCSKNIKALKQKYHISTQVNKVYDITERKSFCSNKCCKASNYVKAQLSTDAFWVRKEKPLKVQLLSEHDNSGSAGEEVDIGYLLTKDEVVKEISTEPIPSAMSDLLQREVDICSDFKDLKIKEHVFKAPYQFKNDKKSDIAEPTVPDETDSSEESTEERSSDEDNNYFPDYENAGVRNSKLMPVPLDSKKAVMISPLNATKSNPVTSSELSLAFVHRVLCDWVTEDTIKYLIGEHKLYSLKADLLFNQMTSSRGMLSDKLTSIKEEYVNLCLKLDNQDEADEPSILPIEENSTGGLTREEKILNAVLGETELLQKAEICQPKVKKRIHRNLRKNKKGPRAKTVQFAPTEKTDNCEEEDTKNLPSAALPLIDSKSQNALRKQIVTNRLKIAYVEVLSLIGQSYSDISLGVRKLIQTFSLSPANISYKPKQWKLIALILFRMLTKILFEDICEGGEYFRMVELSKLPITLTMAEIDQLIIDVTGSQQLQRLQGSFHGK